MKMTELRSEVRELWVSETLDHDYNNITSLVDSTYSNTYSTYRINFLLLLVNVRWQISQHVDEIDEFKIFGFQVITHRVFIRLN